MLYLYLDESGDLGFDFVNKNPSKFFTITILAVRGVDQNRKLINAVKKTIKRKLNTKSKPVYELKGTRTTIETKKYFYNQVKDIEFDLYSVSIDKKQLLWKLIENKERIYNFVARQVVDQIPFGKSENSRIFFIIDKSKGRKEIEEFNSYIRANLDAKINPLTPIDIYHWNSIEHQGLQACDLFCYGIFQHQEHKEDGWFGIFKEDKIRLNQILNFDGRAL